MRAHEFAYADAVAKAVPRAPRQPQGAPDSRGGQFTAGCKDESAVELTPDTAWVTGQIHPTGGYDEIREDADTGAVYYLQDGRPHREDGPAITLADGTQMWMYEGALHRDDDLPASVLSTGEREWYRYGAQHRGGDLPAVVHPDGTSIWLTDGNLHRSGGNPAVVYPSGHTEWWVNGELHRPAEYGPAKIRSNGDEEYWEHGKRIQNPHRQD